MESFALGRAFITIFATCFDRFPEFVMILAGSGCAATTAGGGLIPWRTISSIAAERLVESMPSATFLATGAGAVRAAAAAGAGIFVIPAEIRSVIALARILGFIAFATAGVTLALAATTAWR
jgi:hypothetical protein